MSISAIVVLAGGVPSCRSQAASTLIPPTGSVNDHCCGKVGVVGDELGKAPAHRVRVLDGGVIFEARRHRRQRVAADGLHQRQDPDVADAPVGDDRHAHATGKARQECGPVGLRVAGEPHHELVAGVDVGMARSAAGARRRPLEPGAGGNRGLRPEDRAVLAERAQSWLEGGGVDRLGEREFERSGACHAGLTEPRPGEHLQVSKLCGRKGTCRHSFRVEADANRGDGLGAGALQRRRGEQQHPQCDGAHARGARNRDCGTAWPVAHGNSRFSSLSGWTRRASKPDANGIRSRESPRPGPPW